MSPIPNTWTTAEAVPARLDPFLALERSEGSPPFGMQGGEVPAPASRGHWSEVLKFNTPAPWILIALVLIVGVQLHASGRAGRARAVAGVEL